MNTSFLTEEELTFAQVLPLDTPYLIGGVKHTQFSIARYYGGTTFNGQLYTYFPATDELIRDDVLKMVTKNRKKANKATNIKQKELL